MRDSPANLHLFERVGGFHLITQLLMWGAQAAFPQGEDASPEASGPLWEHTRPPEPHIPASPASTSSPGRCDMLATVMVVLTTTAAVYVCNVFAARGSFHRSFWAALEHAQTPAPHIPDSPASTSAPGRWAYLPEL